MVLDLFLALVDITSVRGFASKFDLILLFETLGFFSIFVSVVSSTFNKLPFVLGVGVTRKISKRNRSYYKLSKTPPIAIISPMVLNR